MQAVLRACVDVQKRAPGDHLRAARRGEFADSTPTVARFTIGRFPVDHMLPFCALRLTTSRAGCDLLLPELISGEIDVYDEAQAEEVTEV